MQTVTNAEYRPFLGLSYDPKYVRTEEQLLSDMSHEIRHSEFGLRTEFGRTHEVIEFLAYLGATENRPRFRRVAEWMTFHSKVVHETWAVCAAFASMADNDEGPRLTAYRQRLPSEYLDFFDLGLRLRDCASSVKEWIEFLAVGVGWAGAVPAYTILDAAATVVDGGSWQTPLGEDICPNCRPTQYIDSIQTAGPMNALALVRQVAEGVTARKTENLQHWYKDLMAHRLFDGCIGETEIPGLHMIESLATGLSDAPTQAIALAWISYACPEKKNWLDETTVDHSRPIPARILKDCSLAIIGYTTKPEYAQMGRFLLSTIDFRHARHYRACYQHHDLERFLAETDDDTTVAVWRTCYDPESMDMRLDKGLLRQRRHVVIVNGPMFLIAGFVHCFLRNNKASVLFMDLPGETATRHIFLLPQDHPRAILYVPMSRYAWQYRTSGINAEDGPTLPLADEQQIRERWTDIRRVIAFFVKY